MATSLNIYELFLAALLLALRMIYLRNLINIKALLQPVISCGSSQSVADSKSTVQVLPVDTWFSLSTLIGIFPLSSLSSLSS
jgi:hypothetical protein